MMTCAVYGCTNNSRTTPTIQFYYFPKHENITQQWVTACWSSEPIDLDNAQMCSIHFDTSCYTSEYKFFDYLGNYARVLKYDAVPTLYLPQQLTSPTTLLKSQVQQETTTPINSNQIILYELANNVSNETSDDQNVKTYVEVSSEPVTPTINIKEEPASSHNDDKYKHITTTEQLDKLKSVNDHLQEQINQVEQTIQLYRATAHNKTLTLKTKSEEFKQLVQECDVLNKQSMSMVDQRSILSKVFSESQIKILSGKKKIYWSNDDMAIGHTIRHLSNKRCYVYLNKHLNIPLPGLSSLKRWATVKKSESSKEEKQGDLTEFKDDSD